MKKKLFLMIFILGYLSSAAQISEMLNSDLYRARVKLVSEFMNRFNGDEVNPYIDSEKGDKEKLNLCQLFDTELILSNRQVNEPKAFQFIDSVINNKVKLDFGDAEWFAKVKCIGQFKGKEVTFYLYLTVEPRGADMYKWVISDVEGKIFDLTPSRESEKIFILPNEHESDFMHLNSITKEKDDYITLYSSFSIKANRLSVFNTLVYYDFLNIDYISDIEYTFLQVPGFIFTIREVERESTNAGWLITDWLDVPEEVKTGILQRLYNGEYVKRKSMIRSRESSELKHSMPHDEAICKVGNFVSCLDQYIKEPSYSDSINEAVKGRYKFIISADLCDRLAKFHKEKPEKSYRLNTLLDWLGGTRHPVRSLEIADAEIFTDEDIRDEYINDYTLVKCKLKSTGEINVEEEVVFFIYENQIAGVKRITEVTNK